MDRNMQISLSKQSPEAKSVRVSKKKRKIKKMEVEAQPSIKNQGSSEQGRGNTPNANEFPHDTAPILNRKLSFIFAK